MQIKGAICNYFTILEVKPKSKIQKSICKITRSGFPVKSALHWEYGVLPMCMPLTGIQTNEPREYPYRVTTGNTIVRAKSDSQILTSSLCFREIKMLSPKTLESTSKANFACPQHAPVLIPLGLLPIANKSLYPSMHQFSSVKL